MEISQWQTNYAFSFYFKAWTTSTLKLLHIVHDKCLLHKLDSESHKNEMISANGKI